MQPTCIRITFAKRTKGKCYGVKIHTRPCVRSCVCVCVRARVGVCVCVCAWVRGFVSRFFSRGCVRVCVCACGWGGVQCRRSFWARARRLVSTYTPGTQRDKLFTFTTTPRLFTTTPLPRTQGDKLFPFTTNTRLFTFPKGCLPLPRLACYLSIGYLVVG